MIRYIDRTRAYYGALGYPPYTWANYDAVPFTRLKNPLGQSKLALVTTAAPFRADLPDQGPGAKYNAEAKFFDVFTAPVEPVPDLRISHIGYDRKHCRADDAETWLPVRHLKKAVTDGLVGSLAERLIGAPTNRSQRVTLEQDAPNVLAACQEQNSDCVLLVPT